jgi:hypothetical protein
MNIQGASIPTTCNRSAIIQATQWAIHALFCCDFGRYLPTIDDMVLGFRIFHSLGVLAFLTKLLEMELQRWLNVLLSDLV